MKLARRFALIPFISFFPPKFSENKRNKHITLLLIRLSKHIEITSTFIEAMRKLLALGTGTYFNEIDCILTSRRYQCRKINTSNLLYQIKEQVPSSALKVKTQNHQKILQHNYRRCQDNAKISAYNSPNSINKNMLSTPFFVFALRLPHKEKKSATDIF